MVELCCYAAPMAMGIASKSLDLHRVFQHPLANALIDLAWMSDLAIMRSPISTSNASAGDNTTSTTDVVAFKISGFLDPELECPCGVDNWWWSYFQFFSASSPHDSRAVVNAALVRRYTGDMGNKNKGKREDKKQAKPKPKVAPGRKREDVNQAASARIIREATKN